MATIGKTLLERAQETVAEVNRSVRSSHQITDRIELTALKLVNFDKCIGSTLTKDQAYSLAYWGIERQKVFEAIDLAARQSRLQIDDLTRSLAASRFGVGECGELMTRSLEKMYEFCPALFVVIGNQSYSAINHTFLIMSNNSQELKQIVEQTGQRFKNRPIELDEFLKTVPRYMILMDPFLKIACLLQDLDRQGADLKRYARAYDLREVTDLNGLEQNSPKFKVVQALSEKVYALALPLLEKIPESGIYAVFLHRTADEVREFLSALAPSLKWKSNTQKSLKIFSTCSAVQAKQISSLLREKGIDCQMKKVKDSDNFCVLVENPDISILRQAKAVK